MVFPDREIVRKKRFICFSIEKAKSELAIVHFNLRSLIKNKSKVQTFLMQLPILPEVIAVTETKLNLKSELLQADLENYQFAHKDSTSKDGGVGLYVRNDLNFVLKPAMSVKSWQILQ